MENVFFEMTKLGVLSLRAESRSGSYDSILVLSRKLSGRSNRHHKNIQEKTKRILKQFFLQAII